MPQKLCTHGLIYSYAGHGTLETGSNATGFTALYSFTLGQVLYNRCTGNQQQQTQQHGPQVQQRRRRRRRKQKRARKCTEKLREVRLKFFVQRVPLGRSFAFLLFPNLSDVVFVQRQITGAVIHALRSVAHCHHRIPFVGRQQCPTLSRRCSSGVAERMGRREMLSQVQLPHTPFAHNATRIDACGPHMLRFATFVLNRFYCIGGQVSTGGANPAAPAARYLRNYRETEEIVPFVNRTFEWGVVIATFLSVLPRRCARLTYFLHPQLRP